MCKKAFCRLTKVIFDSIFIPVNNFLFREKVSMYRKIFSSVVVLACLSAICAENLVPNGDFTGDKLTGWGVNVRPVSVKSYTVKDGILLGQYQDGVKQKNFVAASAQLPELDRKSKYEFGAKIKINAAPKEGKHLQIAIREVGANGRTAGYQNIFPLLTKNGEWIEVTKVLPIRSQAVKHQFYIVMCNFEPGETVEVDYAFVRKIEQQTAPAGNFVLNGDFENGLSGWIFASDAKAASTSVAFDAEKGKVLRLTGDPANRHNAFKTVSRSMGKLDAGKYSLTFDAKSKIVPGKKKVFYVRVRTTNEKGRTLRYYGKAVDVSKKDWHANEAVFTLNGKAADNQLYISIQNFTAEDVVYLDNIVLKKL